MSTPLNISRVTQMPQALAANTIYILKKPGETEASMTITGRTPEVVATLTGGGAATSSIYSVSTVSELASMTPEVASVAYVRDTEVAFFFTPGNGWKAMKVEVEQTWQGIADKPASPVAAIDEAVAVKHSHENISVINGFTDDGGVLKYKGAPVQNVVFTTNW